MKREYDAQVDAEWERLSRPYSQLELVSTLHLIDEHLPPEGHVADIGGGPGHYAVELLRAGHRVTLVDLSSEAVAFARGNLATLDLHAEAIHCADARDLSPSETSDFNAALLLGPMYHIIARDDRAQALHELRRVLKPGAPAIVGFINPWGVLRSGLTEFADLYADYDMVSNLTHTWVQEGEQHAFTEAAFLTPPQALAELRDAGFAVVTRAGAEGFASGALNPVTAISETGPTARDTIHRLVAETCELHAFRDGTEHLYVVVRCLK